MAPFPPFLQKLTLIRCLERQDAVLNEMVRKVKLVSRPFLNLNHKNKAFGRQKNT